MKSAQSLLARSIDYAGMFPPASLSGAEAAFRYDRYLTGADSWLLGRFVCHGRRLDELLLPGDSQWPVAVVAAVSETADRFWMDLADELEQLTAFQERYGGRARVKLFEVPLPTTIVTEALPTSLQFFARESAERIVGIAPDVSVVLFEPPLIGDWQQRIKVTAAALAAVNQHFASESEPLRVGLKLRTGGSTTCPTSKQIALLIAACRENQLCWKATAGLHQPLRQMDHSTGGPVYGFVNLLAAAVLAATNSLATSQIQEILDDDRAASFVFRNHELRWREWRASTQQIAQVRRQSLLSFGSCSFEEPAERLRQLGWWKG